MTAPRDEGRTADLDPERIDAMASALAGCRHKRVDRETLWNAFASAFPGRPQGAEERRWLLAACRELERRGAIALPPERGRRWERSLGVSVPRSVDLVRERRDAAERSWKTFPWHPRLQWVADLRHLPAAHESFLRRVHEGLVNGWFEAPAPLKYRSLQLTGEEKKLLELSRTRLFEAGRLDLDLLGCFREAPPVAWEAVGEAPRAIVFENAGPFVVARAVLERLPASGAPYGIVVYGGGRGFERSVRYLATVDRRLERIDYVGDLDRRGLEIARAAQAEARAAGLPEIAPATPVHRAMLEGAARFAPAGADPGWPDATEADAGRPRELGGLDHLLDFLEDDVRGRVASLLRRGRRIPEEVLGPDELRELWASGASG